MQRYHFEPKALIGWMRIARPGSVIGIQQNFLCEVYQRITQFNLIGQPRFKSENNEEESKVRCKSDLHMTSSKV